MSTKQLSLVLAMACMTVTGTALADAVLLVGENVIVTKIDDQKISNGFLSNPIRKFQLPAGQHKITAKYERLYDLTSDDHDIVRSTELTVLAQMQDSQSYKLVMSNQPDAYEKAVSYAEKPTMSLLNGGNVVASKTAITGSTGFLGGVTGSIGQIFTGKERQGDTVVINTNRTDTKHGVHSTTDGSRVSQQNKSTLDQFMRVWLNATPDERVKIKNWVEGQ